MALDLSQIKEILQKPEKTQVIHRAVTLQKTLRFHTETNISVSDLTLPATAFLDWVRGLLPKDKYRTFLQLFKYPLSTTAVVEDVYRELERVFYSRNSSMTYRFASSELESDWADYRIRKLNEPQIWQTKGWHEMQVSPNSVLVVDLPSEQTTEKPEPYFYWLGIEDVIDYSSPDGVILDWVVFHQPDNKIAVFDDNSIRVFALNEKNEIASLVTEAVHGLGFCTARFFWSTKLNERNPDLKKNPITKQLSSLDWYLFFSISKKHLDLYAPYPIYSAYESECNFENNETGDYCDGGFLRNRNDNDNYKILADGTVARCPCCGEKRIAGPGSFLEVPVPNQSEGIADIGVPVHITTVDRDSLDYNVEECRRLHDAIVTSIVGTGGNVQDKEAINETQVAANFESKTSVLNSLKVNFERAQKFVDDTICQLRYGDGFISSSINWGTEFYVFTVEELYAKYEKAKQSGMSESELDAIVKHILEVEYRNNPQILQRMLILRQLEPYPHKTLGEIITLSDKGLLDPKKVQLKINFSSYISRFERENIDIVSFGANIPLKDKIRIINEKLSDYVSEEQTEAPAGATGTESGEGGSGAGQGD